MVTQYMPVKNALKALPLSKTILLSPQGKILTQEKLKNLSEEKSLTFICGRYEG